MSSLSALFRRQACCTALGALDLPKALTVVAPASRKPVTLVKVKIDMCKARTGPRSPLLLHAVGWPSTSSIKHHAAQHGVSLVSLKDVAFPLRLGTANSLAGRTGNRACVQKTIKPIGAYETWNPEQCRPCLRRSSPLHLFLCMFCRPCRPAQHHNATVSRTLPYHRHCIVARAQVSGNSSHQEAIEQSPTLYGARRCTAGACSRVTARCC